MKRILVAGGAGFLGSWLCDRLLVAGHSVLCVDNLLTGNKKNISKNIFHKNFSFQQLDITKNKDLHFDKIDAIYHLASPASPNAKSKLSYMRYPIETLLANSIGTYNLLETAKKFKAKFLFASSSEIYGEPEKHPQEENYFGNVNPNGPRSCYDEAKRFGEALTFSYLRKFNLDIRVVRIFNTYGPRMDQDDGRVVSNFIVAALQNKPLTIFGTGSQTRSFSYVSDTIEGILLAMNEKKARGMVINLGNDNEVEISELACLIGKLMNKKMELKFESLPVDDPSKRRPDLKRAKEILGYQPRIELEEGILKTIEYFKKDVKV